MHVVLLKADHEAGAASLFCCVHLSVATIQRFSIMPTRVVRLPSEALHCANRAAGTRHFVASHSSDKACRVFSFHERRRLGKSFLAAHSSRLAGSCAHLCSEFMGSGCSACAQGTGQTLTHDWLLSVHILSYQIIDKGLDLLLGRDLDAEAPKLQPTNEKDFCVVVDDDDDHTVDEVVRILRKTTGCSWKVVKCDLLSGHPASAE